MSSLPVRSSGAKLPDWVWPALQASDYDSVKTLAGMDLNWNEVHPHFGTPLTALVSFPQSGLRVGRLCPCSHDHRDAARKQRVWRLADFLVCEGCDAQRLIPASQGGGFGWMKSGKPLIERGGKSSIAVFYHISDVLFGLHIEENRRRRQKNAALLAESPRAITQPLLNEDQARAEAMYVSELAAHVVQCSGRASAQAETIRLRRDTLAIWERMMSDPGFLDVVFRCTRASTGTSEGDALSSVVAPGASGSGSSSSRSSSSSSAGRNSYVGGEHDAGVPEFIDVPANSVFLRSVSPVLSAMLSEDGGFREALEKVIRVDDSPVVVAAFLQLAALESFDLAALQAIDAKAGGRQDGEQLGGGGPPDGAKSRADEQAAQPAGHKGEQTKKDKGKQGDATGVAPKVSEGAPGIISCEVLAGVLRVADRYAVGHVVSWVEDVLVRSCAKQVSGGLSGLGGDAAIVNVADPKSFDTLVQLVGRFPLEKLRRSLGEVAALPELKLAVFGGSSEGVNLSPEAMLFLQRCNGLSLAGAVKDGEPERKRQRLF